MGKIVWSLNSLGNKIYMCEDCDTYFGTTSPGSMFHDCAAKVKAKPKKQEVYKRNFNITPEQNEKLDTVIGTQRASKFLRRCIDNMELIESVITLGRDRLKAIKIICGLERPTVEQQITLENYLEKMKAPW